jgi:tetratricopeptide (TPR) repeat protein
MGWKSVRWLAVLVFLTLPIPYFADIIYFKDGSVLIVEKAWEEGDQVKYQTPSGVKIIPRDTVSKIKAQQAVPSPDPSAPFGLAIPLESASKPPATIVLPAAAAGKEQVSDELIKRLREAVSSDPSSPAARRRLVEALNIYASMQVLKGEARTARDLLQEAYQLDKNFRPTLVHLAVVNYQASAYHAAENLLLEALRLQDRDSYAHYLLGEAYYAQDKVPQAIQEWKTALDLGADQALSAKIKKAEEEAGVHNELGVLHSAHFILRYDRQVSDYNLGENILVTLEQLYRRLTAQLTAEAPETVAVILYTQQTYFDITQAPQWSGALFDGKIRVPAKGLMGVSKDLENMLLHELTHSFLHSSCQERCPIWFHEGVAQWMEGKSASNYRKILVELSRNQKILPLNRLESSFMGLPRELATVAYIEGLSAVEYLVEKYGNKILPALVESMRQNYTFAQAFEASSSIPYSSLQADWEAWLKE